MKNYRRYVGVNDNIREAMQPTENGNALNSAIDFWNRRDQKFTFNEDQDTYFLKSFFPSFPSKAWNVLADAYQKIVFQKKRIPIQADIAITGACHCNCWHCYHSKHTVQQLSLTEIQKCFHELEEMGTCTVGLTGGEPMLHPDIKEIIRSIPEHIEAQLYTTGHAIDEAFAAFLEESRVTRCIISLDHYKAEIANEKRQFKEAFLEAVTAIEILSKTNLYTAVTVCITNELLLEGELENYFSFVTTLPINELRVVMPIPQGKLEGEDVRQLYGKAIRKVKNFRKQNALSTDTPTVLNFCEFESSSYLGCSAGANYLAINNDGAVLPCVAVPLSFGNIKEQSLVTIFSQMEEYFNNSGKVCYGKQIGKAIGKDPTIDTSVYSLTHEVSKKVAKKNIVQGKRGAFFEVAEQEANTHELL